MSDLLVWLPATMILGSLLWGVVSEMRSGSR